jgi:hypothetical protein
MNLRLTIARLLVPEVFAAFRAFPHFQNGEDVTPKRINALASEWQEMIMGWAPSESQIDFIDQDGILRRIVDEPGDWEAGISGGWCIDSDEDWEVNRAGTRDALAYARQFVERWCHTQGNNADFFAATLAPIDAALGRAPAAVSQEAGS